MKKNVSGIKKGSQKWENLWEKMGRSPKATCTVAESVVHGRIEDG
jgi:hypothetical protein